MLKAPRLRIATLLVALPISATGVNASDPAPAIRFMDDLEPGAGLDDPTSPTEASPENSEASSAVGTADGGRRVRTRQVVGYDPGEQPAAAVTRRSGRTDRERLADPFAEHPSREAEHDRKGAVDRHSGQNDRLEDDQLLDKAARTIGEISFQKLFVDLDLLRDRSSPLSNASPMSDDSRACDDRDPYFGYQQTTAFSWAASNLAHRTLYFDDDPLERYGYSCSPLLQPAISAGEFAKDLIAAPIRGIFDGPHKCHFVAGRPRVGSGVCFMKERLVPCTQR